MPCYFVHSQLWAAGILLKSLENTQWRRNSEGRRSWKTIVHMQLWLAVDMHWFVVVVADAAAVASKDLLVERRHLPAVGVVNTKHLAADLWMLPAG